MYRKKRQKVHVQCMWLKCHEGFFFLQSTKWTKYSLLSNKSITKSASKVLICLGGNFLHAFKILPCSKASKVINTNTMGVKLRKCILIPPLHSPPSWAA